MRVAFSSMASNTGCNSPGELEMTFSTSRGRGLLLQRFGEIVGALAQFVEQPRVLDGDDGLRGEVLHQRDLLVGERPHLLAVDAMTPTSSPSLSIGTTSKCARAASSTSATSRALPSTIGLFCLQIDGGCTTFCSAQAASGMSGSWPKMTGSRRRNSA